MKYITILHIVICCTLSLFAQRNTGFLVPFEKDGLWGLMNTSYELVVEPKFEEAYPGYHGRARVKYRGKYGFINEDGDFAVRAKYDQAEDFYAGGATVTKGRRHYAIQTDGRPLKYQREAHSIHSGCIEPILRSNLIVNHQYGFIYTKMFRDQAGNLLTTMDTIPAQFDTIIPITSQLMFVRKSTHGAFLHEGSIHTEPDLILNRLKYHYEDVQLFDSIWPSNKGMISEIIGIKLNGLWGYANVHAILPTMYGPDPKELIPPQFVMISSLEKGFALVQDTTGQIGYVSGSGATYFPSQIINK